LAKIARLHLVDGTFELFRAHFSPRPGHRDAQGRDRKATVGLAGSLISLLQNRSEQVTHLAVAFDNPVHSFRNELFDGYKSEEGLPEELLEQFDDAEDATAALGITVWRMGEFEADDALATGAARYAPQVEQVRIMTPDKDLGQCLVGSSVVQVDRMRDKVTDEAGLLERRGVKPGSLADWLALVGDAADGIPGIPGFGAKSTAKILGRYERIEDIPDSAGRWDIKVRGAERLARNLADRRDDAMLYKRLAILREDVPLTESLDDLEWRGAPKERFLDWCEANAAAQLAGRIDRWQ
jgi:5'-3' exonuclease